MPESEPTTTPVESPRPPRPLRYLWLLVPIVVAGVLLVLVGGTDTTAASDGATSPTPAKKPIVISDPLDPRARSIGGSAYEGNEWAVVKPGEQAAYNQRLTILHRGQRVYNMYCVNCHGMNGDGKGPAASRLITQPRDFTSGIYKFRSTDSSSLPLETDLHRTITRGLSQVSMPAFPLMPETDKLAVIEYVKAFYPAWDKEAPSRKKVFVPLAPAGMSDPARIERGRLVYLGAGCKACHGIDGAGTGATQVQYTDKWGNPQRPFNFTRGQLKGGNDPEDIYRTFRTGLISIMPTYDRGTMLGITQQSLSGVTPDDEKTLLDKYGDTFPADSAASAALDVDAQDQLDQRNSWDLVAYVMSLRAGKPQPTASTDEAAAAEEAAEDR